MSLISSITLLFLLISTSKARTPGTVAVDEFTFDRILEKFDTVLVKFDDRFPKSDKQDHFKRFAESAIDIKRLLIVEVPVSDYGVIENVELAKKYKAEKDDFPVYKLFLKDKSKPLDYPGSADKTEDDLRRFLTQYTNIWVGKPGTVENLDYLARDFFDASSKNDAKGQKTLLKKAREEAAKLVEKKDQTNGESYLKIMEAISKHGLEFLQREKRRVENLLKGKITAEKRVELEHRTNILLSFKSAKDSVMYKLNDAQSTLFNTAQQVKDTDARGTDL